MGGTVLTPMPTKESGYGIRPGGEIIHEAGTTRMGDSPATSVLNKYCQAHEVKNLFVADAGPFVTNAHKNATWTILALAMAHRRVHRRGIAKGGRCEDPSMETRRAAARILKMLGALPLAGGFAVSEAQAQSAHERVAQAEGAGLRAEVLHARTSGPRCACWSTS